MKTTTKLIHDQRKAEILELRKEAKADRKSMRQLIAMAIKKGALVASIALLLSSCGTWVKVSETGCSFKKQNKGYKSEKDYRRATNPRRMVSVH